MRVLRFKTDHESEVIQIEIGGVRDAADPYNHVYKELERSLSELISSYELIIRELPRTR